MGATAYNDESITRYLLGDLAETKQVEIEDRAFRDKEYASQIDAVEDDLIDDYVRGELSTSARRQFERRFLASPERRRKVEFAKALAQVVSEGEETETAAAPNPSIATWRGFLAAFFHQLTPAAMFSLAFAALAIVVGGSWLIAETIRLRAEVGQLRAEQQSQQHDEQALNQRVDAERKHNEELVGNLQREQRERDANEQIINQLQREKEAQANQTQQSSILSLALLPSISRRSSAPSKLVLSETTRLVRLQVGIDPQDQYKDFRAELRGPGAQQVLTRDGLSVRKSPAGPVVVLSFPAKMLGPGQYELALKGVTDGGRTEDVGYYYFDVLKK